MKTSMKRSRIRRTDAAPLSDTAYWMWACFVGLLYALVSAIIANDAGMKVGTVKFHLLVTLVFVGYLGIAGLVRKLKIDP